MGRQNASTPRVLAWAILLLALVTGTILSSVNTVEVWAPRGPDAPGVETFVAETTALRPAGLVLIGAGVVMLTATSLVEMVPMGRASRDSGAG